MVALILLLLLVATGSAVVAAPTTSSDDLEQRVSQLEAALERAKHEDKVRRGSTIFARACAACHGRSGRGDGPAAADLDPLPRDLASRQFRFRTTPSGEAPHAEDLARTIRRGLPGTWMPAFGSVFSASEIDDLVGFIDSLRAEDSLPDAPPEPLPIPSIPPPGPSTLDEGRAVYLLSGCWRCHGLDGSGRGPSSRGLTDENDRPIGTTDFRYDPFKGGQEPEDIARTLLTGLNGAPMPSYGEAMVFAREDVEVTSTFTDMLTHEDLEALEAYIRAAPPRVRVDELGEAGHLELRDRRLAALAHYVLSFDRRTGFWYRFLRQRPEQQARKP